MGDIEIRAFRPGDEASLLDAFNRVFGEGRGDHRPRTREEWAWAFERNPAGQRIWLGLQSGRVVSQYAALPVRVWIGGEERTFAQIVDSLVVPELRGGGAGGLFVRTARPFFEAHGGGAGDVVHYGWPVERALEVGRAHLGYEVVRTQNVLARELEPGSGEPAGVVTVEDLDHQVRWLYDRCVGAWGASSIRDDVALRWRFLDHPRHRYELLGVRDGEGVLRGLAAMRVGDWILPNLGLLVDWLVPHGEPEVGEALLAAFEGRAAARGARAAVAVLPDWSPWFESFQELGYRVHPSDYLTVARSFDRRYDPAWLRESWWYTLADSDLV